MVSLLMCQSTSSLLYIQLCVYRLSTFSQVEDDNAFTVSTEAKCHRGWVLDSQSREGPGLSSCLVVNFDSFLFNFINFLSFS